MFAFAVAASLLFTAAQPAALRYDLVTDGAITAAGAALWVSSETFLKDDLAPDSCRWCDRDAAGTDTLNPIDRFGARLRLLDEELHTADTLSNIGAFAVLPLAAAATHAFVASRVGGLDAVPVDGLLVAEAVVTAVVFNQAVKFVVGRERPFVHRLGPANALVRDPSDNNLSFFSGHATWAFSLVAASATIADLRGYPGAALIWAVGLPLATGVSVLRMSADKHYLSDVVTGTLVGCAVGVLVPRLFHARTELVAVSVAVAPTGATLDVRF